MIIEKTFWAKKVADGAQYFAYDNAGNVGKFVKKYGGSAAANIKLSDSVASQVPADTEVYSILTNNDPTPPGDRPYRVIADGQYYDHGHATLKEANTVAKSITQHFSTILVVKERVEEAVDSDLITI